MYARASHTNKQIHKHRPQHVASEQEWHWTTFTEHEQTFGLNEPLNMNKRSLNMNMNCSETEQTFTEHWTEQNTCPYLTLNRTLNTTKNMNKTLNKTQPDSRQAYFDATSPIAKGMHAGCKRTHLLKYGMEPSRALLEPWETPMSISGLLCIGCSTWHLMLRHGRTQIFLDLGMHKS